MRQSSAVLAETDTIEQPSFHSRAAATLNAGAVTHPHSASHSGIWNRGREDGDRIGERERERGREEREREREREERES